MYREYFEEKVECHERIDGCVYGIRIGSKYYTDRDAEKLYIKTKAIYENYITQQRLSAIKTDR